MTELVSIIMPCYNCEKTLEKTLNSIYAQKFSNFYLYCVNDGSKDKTQEILDQFASNKPNMTVFHKHNAGQTCAKNDALKIAKGKYIAFIDSDDLWHPSKLMKQVQYMEAHEYVGLSYTNGLFIDENGREQEFIGVSKQLQGQCLQEIILGNAIVASSVMVRKSALDKVGHFDERLTACENWELWTRVASVSELGIIDEPLVYYRRHNNNMSHNLDRMRTNRLIVIAKNEKQYQDILENHKKIIKEAYFKAYQFFGENYLWKLQVKEARKDLFNALRYKPFKQKLYILIAKTLLGKQVLAKVRKVRSRSEVGFNA